MTYTSLNIHGVDTVRIEPARELESDCGWSRHIVVRVGDQKTEIVVFGPTEDSLAIR